MQHHRNRTAGRDDRNLARAGNFVARLNAGYSECESFVHGANSARANRRWPVESGVSALAEHPHSVANHRDQPLDARDQLRVLNLRRMDQLGGDGSEVLAHQIESALEIFALGPTRAGFAPRFLDFRKLDYLSHFLCGAFRINSREYR